MRARRPLVLLLAVSAVFSLTACTSTQGRNIGRAVGVASAVFGGGEVEPIGDALERYRTARDAGEAIGELSEVTRFALDIQQLEGVDVTFTDDGQIDLVLLDPERGVRDLAAVLLRSPHQYDQTIAVEGAGDAAFAFRDALIEQGLDPYAIEAFRTDELEGVVMHIRYRS